MGRTSTTTAARIPTTRVRRRDRPPSGASRPVGRRQPAPHPLPERRADPATRRSRPLGRPAGGHLLVGGRGGMQDLGASASGLTSLGRLTGLARLRPDARAGAADGAAAVRSSPRSARTGSPGQHRLVGFTSFNLMLAHIVPDHLGVRRRPAGRDAGDPLDLVTDLPGHAARTSPAPCSSSSSSATSIRAARARLRYESWHLLHLYAYLGVGLALPHQLWTGQEFLDLAGGDRLLVDRLGARALAAVLVWRVGLPLWRSARHGLRVTSVVHEAPGIVSVYVDRPPPAPAAGRARPVLLLALPGPRGLDPREPVLALGRAGRAQPAHHRQGRSATAARPSPASCARHARARGRAVRPAQRPRPSRDTAASHSSAPGSASRRCGPWSRTSTTPRATPCCSAVSGPAALLPRAAVLARERGLSCALPARPAPRGRLLAGVGVAPRRRRCVRGCPDIAARDVYVCGPEPLGRPRPTHRPRRRHPRRADPHRVLRMVTRVHRIVMFFAGTATAVVLLFGYHTSTAGSLARGVDSAGPARRRLRRPATPHRAARRPGPAATAAATPPAPAPSPVPRCRPSGGRCRCS